MEFTLDIALVRAVLRGEYRCARAQITELGAVAAYERSQQRHDERVAAAPDAATLACKEGCAWCCHFSVDLRPVEVVRILDFIERFFSPGQREQLRAEVEANRAVLAGLDEIERMQRNVKCPFLIEGRCSIYAARPQTCRNYHATDAAGCQKSFDEPDNRDIDPDFAPLVYQSGGAHVDAFSKAMEDEGYDVGAYEMNAALGAALQDTAAFRRKFAARAKPALPAPAAEAPLEFWDMDSEASR
jgi:Fe-S-cluster containining protein